MQTKCTLLGFIKIPISKKLCYSEPWFIIHFRMEAIKHKIH